MSLFNLVSRIIILLIFHATPIANNPTLCAGLSMGISNITILIVSIIFLIIFLLKVKKNGYKGMHFSDPEPEVSKLQFEDDVIDIKEIKDMNNEKNIRIEEKTEEDKIG